MDQRDRFEAQMKLREAGDSEAQMLDEDYLEAMEYGMPPAAGFGLSERLFAVLAGRSIRETVIFPPMKEEGKNSTGKAKETMVAVALLNKSANMAKWQELNAVGHLTAAFGARAGKKLLHQDEVVTKDNQKIKLNIQHAIMLKNINSDEEIRKLLADAKKLGLHIAEFTREMIETTNDKKVIEATAKKNHSEVDYLGVLLFGKKSSVESLTKDYSLYE
jgi:lysyl-tRNA synthetase class 2